MLHHLTDQSLSEFPFEFAFTLLAQTGGRPTCISTNYNNKNNNNNNHNNNLHDTINNARRDDDHDDGDDDALDLQSWHTKAAGRPVHMATTNSSPIPHIHMYMDLQKCPCPIKRVKSGCPCGTAPTTSSKILV